MASLRILFTGLCSYVPRALKAGELDQGSMLLVKTRQIPGSTLDEHFPQLRFNGKVVDLSGKEVAFALTDPKPKQILIAQPAPNFPHLPTPGTPEDRDFRWAPAIDALSPIDTKLADSCFSPLPPQVATRVKITSGNLGAASVVQEITPSGHQPVDWGFRDTEQVSFLSYRQAIATGFLLLSDIDASSIKVNIQEFGGANPETFTVHEVGGEISITIENSCLKCEKEGAFLEDFAWFYDLCEGSGIVRNVPSRPPGGNLTDTYCPPARFNAPHPNA